MTGARGSPREQNPAYRACTHKGAARCGAFLMRKKAPQCGAYISSFVGSSIRLRMESKPVNGRQMTNATNMHTVSKPTSDIRKRVPTQTRNAAPGFRRRLFLSGWASPDMVYSLSCYQYPYTAPLHDNRR